MQYFKHSDLTDKYHVSLKTVHNWIDAAKQGKSGLTLHSVGSRTYIADTPENKLTLEALVQKGKKYRNSLHHKVVGPSEEFYHLYDRRQILDIMTSLEVHREIPRMYNYLGEGAKNWDDWIHFLLTESEPNILTGTVELIHSNLNVLDRLLDGTKKVNIIDLGVGNAYPIKELLAHLLEKGILHRYIGIDISPTMLDLARENIYKWYGDEVHFEGHVRDISYERFDDLVVDDMLDKDAARTVNIVLLLGAIPVNFRSFDSIFDVIRDSVSGNDLLIYTNRQDDRSSIKYFDYRTYHGAVDLRPTHRYILRLMNIKDDMYDGETGFDEIRNMRYIRIKLKTALSIEFTFGNYTRRIDFEKGDTILMLRVWYLTSLETFSIFEDKGFTTIQSSITKDRKHLLSISGVATKAAFKS